MKQSTKLIGIILLIAVIFIGMIQINQNLDILIRCRKKQVLVQIHLDIILMEN